MVLFCRHLEKCDIKMNSDLNYNGGIQFADQENIIIDSYIVHMQPHVRKGNYFRCSSAILNFGVKKLLVKVGMWTAEKLTLENIMHSF